MAIDFLVARPFVLAPIAVILGIGLAWLFIWCVTGKNPLTGTVTRKCRKCGHQKHRQVDIPGGYLEYHCKACGCRTHIQEGLSDALHYRLMMEQLEREDNGGKWQDYHWPVD